MAYLIFSSGIFNAKDSFAIFFGGKLHWSFSILWTYWPLLNPSLIANCFWVKPSLDLSAKINAETFRLIILILCPLLKAIPQASINTFKRSMLNFWDCKKPPESERTRNFPRRWSMDNNEPHRNNFKIPFFLAAIVVVRITGCGYHHSVMKWNCDELPWGDEWVVKNNEVEWRYGDSESL